MAEPEYDYGDAPDVVAGTAAGRLQHHRPRHRRLPPPRRSPAPPTSAPASTPTTASTRTRRRAATTSTASASWSAPARGPATTRTASTFTGPFTPGGHGDLLGHRRRPRRLRRSTPGSTGTRAASSATRPASRSRPSVTIPTGGPTVLAPAVPAGRGPGPHLRPLPLLGGRRRSRPPASPPTARSRTTCVGVVGTDFGDAPASYGTQGAGAASHTVDPLAAAAPRPLRRHRGRRPAGRRRRRATTPTAGTSRVGTCFDDEDGVAFTSRAHRLPDRPAHRHRHRPPASSTPGSTSTRDGDFADAGERDLRRPGGHAPAPTRSRSPSPARAVEGTTYARFRLSTAGGLGAHRRRGRRRGRGLRGQRRRGRLRRRAGHLRHDRWRNGGPNHRVVAGFSLGATVDAEAAGPAVASAPTATAPTRTASPCPAAAC